MSVKRSRKSAVSYKAKIHTNTFDGNTNNFDKYGSRAVNPLARLSLLVVAAVLGSIASVSDAQAMTYYVAPNGNDANPGTLSQPWRTIAKANNELQAGDMVRIRAGTYSDRIRPVKNGTSNSNRITYKAYGDGNVVLTGFPSNDQGPPDGAIGLGGKKYVTVTGRADGDPVTTQRIRLIPQFDVGLLGNVCGSEGVVVENIYAHCQDSGRSCNRGFAFCLNYWSGNYETKYNILRNSHIIGTSSNSNNPSDYTEDLITVAHRAHHNLIDNNTFELCKHSTLYADSPASYSNVIRNNTISNTQHTALSIWSAGVNISQGARFLVENNILKASGKTNSPHGGPGNAFQWGSDELLIRYNVIEQGGSAGNQNSSLGGLTGATSTSFGSPYFATDGRIYNNTIVKNRGVAVGMFDFGSGSVDLGRHKFVNNFLYDSNSSVTGRNLVLYWDGGRNTSDRYIRNVFGNPGGSSGQTILSNAKEGPASLSTAISQYRNPQDPEFTIWNNFSNVYDANPGFANYGGDNYKLPAGNQYLDGGAPLTTVAGSDAGSGTTLKVADSRFFYAEASEFPGWMGVGNDWLAIGPSISSAQKVQISSVNDSTNTIVLSQAVSRNIGDFVWLWKDSDGTSVVLGSAPAIGYIDDAVGTGGTPISAPQNLRIVQ